jgi:hypothetical protein
MEDGAGFDRLSKWEWLSVGCLGIAIIFFGCLVEVRTAFLSRRMGDLNCYLRPAWAVRTGHDIYQICDDCGWHYNYPPFLAILLTPLADPPAGEDHAGMVPYAVSAAIWFLINVGCLALGVHWLCRALEERSSNARVRALPTGCRRWWTLRLIPVLACIVPIGHSLIRGQVNLVVLLCLCATVAALLRAQRARAGWWLAWPICIKVFPAFLLLYPVVRRDGRFLAGCAGGLFVGLVLIPLAALGPARTLDYYLEYFQVTLAPGLGLGHDDSRALELTRVTATDSQALLAILHNSLHLDRWTRPAEASPALRRLSYLLGGLLTVITCWAADRPRAPAGPDLPLFFGALILVMLLLCPVCHLHYFCFSIPLIIGLVAVAWERRPAPQLGLGLTLLLAANFIGNALPVIPGLELLRDLGIAMYAALLLWGTAVILLCQMAANRGGAGEFTGFTAAPGNCVPPPPSRGASSPLRLPRAEGA